MLTQEILKELLHYNQDTGIFTWLADGKGRRSNKIAGTEGKKNSGKKYLFIKIRGKRYPGHRLAFLFVTGSWPDGQVDHISGNGLENEWVNLRDVTNQENSKNQRLRSNNTSDFVGVNWSIYANKWAAGIYVDGKRSHLGFFIDKQDAIDARQSANIKHSYHKNHGSVRPL